MKKYLVSVILIALTATCAYAHQPRIAFGERHPPEDPIAVEKPEISKAYYGQLRGEPDYYRIVSEKPFVLYLNILAPDQESARTDTSVDVMIGGRRVATLSAQAAPWTVFYEKFADDRYLRGPELTETVGAGTYYLRVSNRDNWGKYALAVGNVESFPLDETIKTALTLPVIKKYFFNKPSYSAFLNLVGLFLVIEFFLAAAAVLVIALLIRTITGKMRKRMS